MSDSNEAPSHALLIGSLMMLCSGCFAYPDHELHISGEADGDLSDSSFNPCL
jgi:hypothetical protein